MNQHTLLLIQKLPKVLLSGLITCAFTSCVPNIELAQPKVVIPNSFDNSLEHAGARPADAGTPATAATIDWNMFFQDENLAELINTALANNQELSIFQQELEIANNEAYAKSGAYLPFVELGADAGLDKVGKYTRFGAVEENEEIEPGKEFPEPFRNFKFGAKATWEVDIWSKLRNAEKSALMKFVASNEGKNFLITNLIAEISNSYYELCALDSQLAIVKQNVGIQKDALKTAKLEKEGARITELAVRRFEAQALRTESLQYDTEQKIFQTENTINFLLGRFPQPIKRSSKEFFAKVPQLVEVGVPSELLRNRPDIRQAEFNIQAAELDIKVAQAAFYPSLNLTAEVGWEAYHLGKILKTPDSLLYGIAGGLAGPLLNRRDITANFNNASARQKQAVFNYERTVLNAFVEASTQISNVTNLAKSAALKQKQVEALTNSVSIAGTLFTSARADYSEVLLTQREAIESRFEFIETKLRQMQALVNLYRALGGGWTREVDAKAQAVVL